MKNLLQHVIDNPIEWIVCLFIASFAATAIIALNSDHKVRCYYTKTEMTNAGIAYKVIADIDWSSDVTSFTSGDKDETLQYMSTLKQCAAE